MKVAALVSGGKDSCYALGLAQAAGHDVVALLNLCPADASTEDTDSHCFQTVGHKTVPALAAATGLPLLLRRLTGGSKATGMGYDAAVAGDEVEDLAALLLAAVARFPRLQGVVSGAVASDYQRLRVEHAAARAGLVALAPLWHMPQLELLADMERAGLRAILVKVAAEGLEPGRWLGTALAAAGPHLARLASRLGLNPAGEGGEYETLTLDCPAFVRARLEMVGGVVTPAGGGAGVLAEVAVEVVVRDARVPPGEVAWVGDGAPPTPADAPRTPPLHAPAATLTAGTRASAGGGGTVQAWATVPVTGEVPAEHATAAALATTHARLLAAGVAGGINACSHIRLYLPSMAAFEGVNGVWAAAIPGPAPPARACLAPAGGAAAASVILDAVAPLNPSTRRVLHVQTISPWAPACIGPYAQGVADGGGEGGGGGGVDPPHPPPPNPRVPRAGQIGLDPATLTHVDAVDQPARSLASAAAVGAAMGVDLRTLAVGWTLLGAGGAASLGALGRALRAWSGPVGGRQPSASPSPSTSACSDGYLGGGRVGREEDDRPFTDSYLRAAAASPPTRPVTIYLLAAGLPRGAVAEVEALAVAPEWLGGAPAVPAWAESLGWMGREAGTHSLAAAFSPGAFAHVAVGGHGGACLGDDVHAATAQAMACLEAAGLAAEDVSLARVFVRADGLEAAGAAFPAMLHAAWCGAGFEEPVPVVVPVLAVGLGPAAGEPVVFEVTAGRGG